MSSKVQFRLRVYNDSTIAIGPGKVQLLEAIAEAGSISAAARSLGMSYRRAWVLVDEMNRGSAHGCAGRHRQAGTHGQRHR